VNSRSIVHDICEGDVVDVVRGFLPEGVADVVVSDVSPNISGVWEVDHGRQVDLARRSLYVAGSVLRKGGSFFVKVFQGDLLDGFVVDVRREFRFVRLLKPKVCVRPSVLAVFAGAVLTVVLLVLGLPVLSFVLRRIV
jgi:23S rRNA (uridine2552-2'-O)-methyltransferase